MKKRLPFITLAIICIISISINVLSVFDTHSNLENILVLLDSIVYSISNNDDETVNYTLTALKRECIQLDDFHDMILSDITSNNNPEKVINNITQYRDRLLELIKELSPEGELRYYDHSLNPNYSLSIRQIINSINNTLANMLQAKTN